MPNTIPNVQTLLASLGVPDSACKGGNLPSHSPIDGSALGLAHATPFNEVAAVIARAHAAQQTWRSVPAPQRGELVRLLGEELRTHKQALGTLVSLEAGKVLSE